MNLEKTGFCGRGDKDIFTSRNVCAKLKEEGRPALVSFVMSGRSRL
jgi:hypothetical protein